MPSCNIEDRHSYQEFSEVELQTVHKYVQAHFLGKPPFCLPKFIAKHFTKGRLTLWSVQRNHLCETFSDVDY